MADQWGADAARTGVVTRLLLPQAGAKPATMAFGLGVVSALAFVISMILDWQRVTFAIPSDGGNISVGSGDVFMVAARPGTLNTLGEVYLLGMVGLLGLVGAVLTRPDLALRFRLGVTGVAVGLLGIVIAIAVGFVDESASSFGGIFGGQLHDKLRDSAQVAYQPGLAAAVLAVIAGVAAVWLAARPAARALTPPSAASYAVVEPSAPVQVDELSVSPSQPVDLTTTRDPWSH
jgi:hypothetical protein